MAAGSNRNLQELIIEQSSVDIPPAEPSFLMRQIETLLSER
jgi:hypothetical protein